MQQYYVDIFYKIYMFTFDVLLITYNLVFDVNKTIFPVNLIIRIGHEFLINCDLYF